MKQNIIKALATSFIAVTLFMGHVLPGNAQFTYAAAEFETKTATLNNAKISFNGKEPVTIQAYNIDGYNYVRARDVTDAVNMEVNPILNGEIGIMITSDSPAQLGTPLETLNIKSIKVTPVKGEITYRGVSFYTECFNYNGRYFFKLADIAAASEQSLQLSLELLELQANGDVAKGPMIDGFSSVSVQWNADAGIINVSRVEHDFIKMFNKIRGVEVVAPEEEQNKAITPIPNDNKVSVQPPLASAPEVGTKLANILIDESLGAYTEDGYIIEENLEPVYDKSMSIGQCTWYAACRFHETTGIDIVTIGSPNKVYGSGLTNWVRVSIEKGSEITGIVDRKAITAQSIAVWDGHVSFVEFVEYDDNSNPITVYYTEANSGHDGVNHIEGVYYPDFDCLVQKSSLEDFINRVPGEFSGYIVAK